VGTLPALETKNQIRNEQFRWKMGTAPPQTNKKEGMGLPFSEDEGTIHRAEPKAGNPVN